MGDKKKFRLLNVLILCSLWRACFFKINLIVFMVGFPENLIQGDVFLRITVTNSGAREIDIVITSDIVPQVEYVLRPQSSHTVVLDKEFMIQGSQKTRQGIHITATGAARVYIEEDPALGPKEGTLVVPRRYLGCCYTVVTGVPTEGSSQSEILLVGLKDNTFVSVTINSTTGVLYEKNTYFDGETINLSLDKFDTAQIQSENSDLTGTLIVASSVISVFSANQAITIDKKDGFLFEQMTPMEFWHTHYVTVPPYGSFYYCRIVAALSNTLVWYQCGSSNWKSVTLRNTGSHVLLQFGSAICKVFSNGPIMLTIIIHSETHDPSMVVLQPVYEMYRDVAFYVPVSLESAQIMFVTYTDDLNHIMLDNNYVTNLHTVPIEPDFVGVFGNVQSGTRIIKTTGISLRISGYVFGRHGNKTCGFSLQSGRNNSLVFETGTDEILNNIINESTTLTYDTVNTTPVRDENSNNQITLEQTTSVTVDETNTSGTGIDKSVGTSESSSTGFTTSQINTETTGIPTNGKLETSKVTTVAPGFTTSEIKIEETTSKAIVTNEPNTDTTPSKVKATSKPTTEATITTTLTETTESNIQKTTLKSAIRTQAVDINAGTSEMMTKSTTTIIDRTSARYDTQTVARGGTKLMASEGTTTTGLTNEITSNDVNTTPESKSPNDKLVFCGTTMNFSSKNMKCIMYCRNYTRNMNIRLVDMRANLIDRKKTRRYKRTLMSARDDRMSVQTIGYTGVIVLVSVLLFIVILDLEACKPRKRNQRSDII